MSEESRVSSPIRRSTVALEKITAELAAADHAGLSSDDWLRTRAKLGRLLAELDAAMEGVDRHLDMTGAKNRILGFLRIRLGETVSKDELRGVAGISEWARRVRELRQDDGWVIHSSTTRDDLRVGEYVLELPSSDAGLARRWTRAREFRSLKTAGGSVSATTRLLEFLKAIRPHAADREQLSYVVGSAHELEKCLISLEAEGWQFETVPLDDPVAPGGKRLTGRLTGS